ncbi:Uronate isomerase [Fundidesulfovibrio magnetotacticus]|uniref:Uronate isomerase n=1 Tax=Fundidesulfovibrio magnetotacticus TaxID=2730080 RepID=A0A6V8LVT6_9BACT|nr:glucuronate isomerase [Fundidesulfovibrio magnetotacticus]GFK95854.1 Uronate isomerase [Fundidesulfovibrio magnetotacticus]
MNTNWTMHEDRLFPADPGTRGIARRLYAEVKDLPIVSPHGHTDPRWYAEDVRFPDPAVLFLIPDHYVFRMLHSQGVPLEALGVPRVDGGRTEADPRAIWRLFAENYHLLRGTPSRMWLEHVFLHVFGIEERLEAANAESFYDRLAARLSLPEFRCRALYERYNIEVIATTDSPLDSLEHHKAVLDSGWKGRVVPTFRPDPCVDPDFEGFAANVASLGQLTGEDAGSWKGYLRALAARREFFKSLGATATDHGHPSAATADLDASECERLFHKALRGTATPAEAELFRAQMLTEMVRMSLDDGLVIQIHPGSFRNHSLDIHTRFGRDKGADIPSRTDFVHALKPMLDRFGHERGLTVILFTLDESAYSRELAPLAGVYPVLRLGPAWWFHDSPEGMMRYRRMVTETAGFYNTVGFNDDTRAFLSIPARHDVARRVDCSFLADMVATHRLDEDEAVLLARELAYSLAKKAYRL